MVNWIFVIATAVFLYGIARWIHFWLGMCRILLECPSPELRDRIGRQMYALAMNQMRLAVIHLILALYLTDRRRVRTHKRRVAIDPMHNMGIEM